MLWKFVIVMYTHSPLHCRQRYARPVPPKRDKKKRVSMFSDTQQQQEERDNRPHVRHPHTLAR